MGRGEGDDGEVVDGGREVPLVSSGSTRTQPFGQNYSAERTCCHVRLSVPALLLFVAGALLGALLVAYGIAVSQPELTSGGVQAFAALATIALTVEVVRTSQETAAFARQVEAARIERDQAIFELDELSWEGPQRVDFVIFNVGTRPGALKAITLAHNDGREPFPLRASGIQRVFGKDDEKNDLTVPVGGRVRFRTGFVRDIPEELRENFVIEVKPAVGPAARANLPSRVI